MKIDITLEHKDLLNQILAYLSMQGLKPAGEIRFIKKKTAKGKPQEYEIQISCEAGPIPGKCPICHTSSNEPTTKVPMADVTADIPETEEIYAESDVAMDPDLGESLEPPEGSGEDAAGQRIPSIQTLVAKSKAIEESAQRGKSRPRKPTLMSNESNKPPE